MVDTAAAEPPLGEHLGAVLGAEQVIKRDANVVVDDVVVVAGFGLDLHAGRLAGNDEHAVRAHHEEDVRHSAGGREPLLAVDDPLVAVTDGVSLEQARVRPALRLGHRVGREHVLVHERLEPPLLLLVGPVGGEHLHVPRVRRSGAENLWGRGITADHLVQQSQLQLAEPGTAKLLVEEDRPQPLVLDLLLEAAHVRLDDGVG